MKLSEMRTKQAAACMAELAAPVGVLLKNDAVRQYLNKAAKQEASIPVLSDALEILLPVLFRDHYEETAKILSIMTGKTPDEISEQPVKITIRDVRDTIDGELIGFFTK